MLSFLTIAGLVIAVIVFLNLLSAQNTLRGKGSVARGFGGGKKEKESGPDRVSNVRRFLETPLPEGVSRPRICPVCGSALEQDDFLYAALEPEPESGRKRQAQIYGCRYCLSGDEFYAKKRELSAIDP